MWTCITSVIKSIHPGWTGKLSTLNRKSSPHNEDWPRDQESVVLCRTLSGASISSFTCRTSWWAPNLWWGEASGLALYSARILKLQTALTIHRFWVVGSQGSGTMYFAKYPSLTPPHRPPNPKAHLTKSSWPPGDTLANIPSLDGTHHKLTDHFSVFGFKVTGLPRKTNQNSRLAHQGAGGAHKQEGF